MVKGLRNRVRVLSRLVEGDDLSAGCGSKINDLCVDLESFERTLDSFRDLVYGAAKFSTSCKSDGASTQVVPTVASKVAFPEQLRGFDPRPFLSEEFRVAFEQPDLLLKEQVLREVPPPITSSHTELWHLMWRWDAVDRLCLALETECNPEHACNLFCLAKPDGELRQIIDRRPRNAAELGPPPSAPKMGHASSFLGIIVPREGCLRGCVDDLRNFYHEFSVPLERALSTPVGPRWKLQQFAGSRALQRLERRHPGVTKDGTRWVRACFAGLSMGDHWAPALAQASHEGLLEACGALIPDEKLVLGSPLPRSPSRHYSGVCIDDKVGIQVFNCAPEKVPPFNPDAPPEGRDLEACALAEAAYVKAGLQIHPKKKERRVRVFKAWGAQFEGDTGTVSMDRTRLVSLCVCTARVAAHGVITERVLQKLLGLWAFAFQFRRPLFAIFEVAYHVSHPSGNPSTPFRMPRGLVQELQLASVLGLAAVADLKAQVCPVVFATDASPEGAGIVGCKVGMPVAAEIFRRADMRGFHTRLLSPISAYLQEQGMGPQEPEFLLQSGVEEMRRDLLETQALEARQPRWQGEVKMLSEMPSLVSEWFHKLALRSGWSQVPKLPEFRLDFVELFGGSSGITAAMHERGFVVGPAIEMKSGWDLFDQSLFYLLLGLCLAGRIGMLWLSPPCRSFSVARHPRLRSTESPLGLELLDSEVVEGNLLLHSALALFLAQLSVGSVAVVSTPWSAYARKVPWWQYAVGCSLECRVDMCRFGALQQKPTALLTSVALFKRLSKRCRCSEAPHARVVSSRSVSQYPVAFCKEVAGVFEDVCTLRDRKPGPVASESAHNFDSARWGDLRDHRGAQRFVSHLWATHLAESLPWKPLRAYRFARPNHINVLECHARKTLMNLAPMNSRVVCFQDSLVTLGATSKGRSSSHALNSVLRQDMALQIAKNIYPVGVHCPTWALRADDPSRRRKVRPPRIAVPKWLLSLRAGALSSGQDGLDRCSDTPRSWARWLLLGQAAAFAAAGDFTSVGAWAKAWSSASRPEQPGPWTRHPGNSESAHKPLGQFPAVVERRRDHEHAVARVGAAEPDRLFPASGGIRTGPLRKRGTEEELCRNSQHGEPKVSLPEELHGWAVGTVDHLGDPTPESRSSANATAAAQGFGGHGVELGLDAICSDAFDRVLRFTEALRNVRLEGQRLHSQQRQWVCQRHLPTVGVGESEDSRCEAAECTPRGALCRRLPAKILKSHDNQRTALELLSRPLSEPPQDGPQRGCRSS